jgi:hypothetical protein
MNTNHRINKLFNRGLIVSQPDWRRTESLKDWSQTQVKKEINEAMKPKREVHVYELAEEDTEGFSKLIRNTIKDYNFLSGMQRLASSILRSP